MAKHRRASAPVVEELISPVNGLDDGCLMHIFSFLSPIPVIGGRMTELKKNGSRLGRPVF